MNKTKSNDAKSSDFKSKRLKNKSAKNKDIKKRHPDQGFILTVGVVVMAFLLLLVVPFLYQLSFEKRLTDKSYKSSAAFFLAEAGVERAIWELNYGDISTWDGDSSLRTMTISSLQTPSGNVIGDIDIRIEEPNADNPVVESTGRVASAGSLQVISKTTRIVLKRGGPPPIFDYGAFGNVSVEIESNAIIDSYDSRVGPYGGSNIGCSADVGTNATTAGSIDLLSNAEIHGNAFSGPESNPDQAILTRENSVIYGEKQALSSPKEMPSITAPEGLTYRGGYSLTEGTDTISQSGEYTSFRLDSNSKVTITGDVTLYVTGEFSMLSNAQLEIAEGASLEIYIGGSFVQGSNSQINNLTQDPTQLLLFGTDTLTGMLEWNSNALFWGAVYAPQADVNFNSNVDFYGSIIANRIDSISSNTKIHYDEALADLSVEAAGENSPLEVKSWQVK